MTKDDRKRQVATTRSKNEGRIAEECHHQPKCTEWYQHIGKMGGQAHATFRDPAKARLAQFKRWYPHWFDEDGEFIEEFRPTMEANVKLRAEKGQHATKRAQILNFREKDNV